MFDSLQIILIEFIENLAQKNRFIIPSCVVESIRTTYPDKDGVYEGYHEII